MMIMLQKGMIKYCKMSHFNEIKQVLPNLNKL